MKQRPPQLNSLTPFEEAFYDALESDRPQPNRYSDITKAGTVALIINTAISIISGF